MERQDTRLVYTIWIVDTSSTFWFGIIFLIHFSYEYRPDFSFEIVAFQKLKDAELSNAELKLIEKYIEDKTKRRNGKISRGREE